ncbi:MAG: phosphoribosylanthranilate isomerase [Vicinamibacteria bacterium]|nr:phosphoribosylanthranilate isomerase [Vicinamibacteria bacterium]
MTWIKVCGITSKPDAEAAIRAGVSAIGLVMAPSPRRVTLEKAIGIAAIARGRVEVVGVFKDPAAIPSAHAIVGFDRVQFHGDAPLEVPVSVLRAIRPEALERTASHEGETTLIDGSEGKGAAFDWTRVRSRAGAFVIAGGLTPENVGEAVAVARPFGVDVSSGVESAPGRKDPEKMARFVLAVRRADAAR